MSRLPKYLRARAAIREEKYGPIELDPTNPGIKPSERAFVRALSREIEVLRDETVRQRQGLPDCARVPRGLIQMAMVGISDPLLFEPWYELLATWEFRRELAVNLSLPVHKLLRKIVLVIDPPNARTLAEIARLEQGAAHASAEALEAFAQNVRRLTLENEAKKRRRSARVAAVHARPNRQLIELGKLVTAYRSTMTPRIALQPGAAVSSYESIARKYVSTKGPVSAAAIRQWLKRNQLTSKDLHKLAFGEACADLSEPSFDRPNKK
ncbi:hypothetical protein [Piscinibacterium candidicorallinum]|uniref:Uncharacterized protein n=1 Tax=Piscinibacterium candidicorallinum TaxID=1793872 RepID=A0ABV7H5I0_9BURK